MYLIVMRQWTIAEVIDLEVQIEGEKKSSYFKILDTISLPSLSKVFFYKTVSGDCRTNVSLMQRLFVKNLTSQMLRYSSSAREPTSNLPPSRK